MSRFLRLVAIAFVAGLFITPLSAQLQVTNNSDLVGTVGSLRWAINQANVGACGANPCVITFNAPMTINTSGNLAIAATVPVIIDGFATTGASANTAAFPSADNAVRNVILNGPSNTCGCKGLVAQNTSVTIQGLVVQNFAQGIALESTFAQVFGNRIQNNSEGVAVQVNPGPTNNNYIGGSAPADRNIVVSNNTGVAVYGLTADTFIDGNFVGISPDTLSPLPNGTGIGIFGPSVSVGSGASNLVAGNTFAGIFAAAGGIPLTSVHNNLIGITGLGNGGAGIEIQSNDVSVMSNSIRDNSGPGVLVTSGKGTVVHANIIEGNGGIGIDLDGSSNFGPTANDATDSDSFAGNNLQNYPVIASAYLDPVDDDIYVTFNLDSSATSNFSIRTEMYQAAPAPHEGGLQYLGDVCWSNQKSFTNAKATYNSGTLSVGDTVNMTATGYADFPCSSPSDGTSEFSASFVLGLLPGIVVNTNDSGAGSLRQAILDANSFACDDGSGQCLIKFAIPLTDPGYNAANGTWTIRPLSPFATIARSDVRIEGWTQAQYISGDPNPLGPEIIVNGSLAGPAVGFQVIASSSMVSNVSIEHLVINGFATAGVLFQGTSALISADSNSVYDCYIGTSHDGGSAVPNGTGIILGPNSTDNFIGSGAFIANVVAKSSISGMAASSGGNVISGNSGAGIEILNTNFSDIVANLIGTDSTGTLPVPNNIGIHIHGALTQGTTVGGNPATFEPNTIAFNTNEGILVESPPGHRFDRNSIHSNGALGIDLGNDGVTANDPGDVDTGANNLQNFPVITSVTNDTFNTTVSGTFNGLPGADHNIDVFTSTLPDPSGYGEGQVFQSRQSVTTDISGNATFTATFPGVHRWVSTLATHLPSAASPVTSEFGAVFNNPPDAVNDPGVTTVAGTPVLTTVTANDSDPDGDSFSVTAVTSPTANGGTVTCGPNDCTYTSLPTFSGTDTYTYTITDPAGATDTATVTVTVSAANQPPVANDDTATTQSNAPVTTNVLANDSDPEAGALTIQSFTQGSSGTVTCVAPNCTYTPNTPSFFGTDTYTYTIADPAALTDTATVTVTVTNRNPIATADSATTPSGTAVTTNVLANDSDPEGHPFVITGSTNGANGTVICITTCTYTPNAGFVGNASYTYTIQDSFGGTATGTVSVTVTNQAPTAVNDTASTSEGSSVLTNVLANDSDPEGQALSIVSGGPASNGTVACSTPNCTYTPLPGFSGTDSYSYTIQDSFGATSTATVTVTVTALPNQPPVAVDDSASTFPGGSVTTNVLANDSDPDGDPLSISMVVQGSQGTVSCNPTGNCTYTANAGASGSDTYGYKVSDGNGGFDDGVVFVTISLACPSAPTLNSPAAGSSGAGTSGTMSWSGDGDLFEVFFGPVGQGCSMSQASTPNQSYFYSGLAGDTEYEWRVVASRGSCPSESSGCQTFRTARSCNASAPTPLTPSAGASVSSPIIFSWTASPGATNYRVFATDGGSDILLGQTGGTSLSASLPDSSSSWYVVAEGIPGCGNLRSASTAFQVCNAPSAPLASVVGEATSAQTYTVSWQPVAGATHYEVVESTDPGFNNAVAFPTTELFMTFTKNITSATGFYYQVRAFSACFNGFGGASPTIRVVVVPVPPRDDPNTNGNAPVGSTLPIVLKVFVAGEPGQTLRFTATGDKPWMRVVPDSGLLPEDGIVLDVYVDPRDLPNGTFTGTVIVTLGEPASGRVGTHSNHTRSTPVSINLVTPVTPVSPGPPNASSLIIPAVGHLDGSDAKWRSDVRIANTSGALNRYLVTFTPGNPSQGVKQTSIEIAPGETTALDDIVRAWYGIGSLGESSNGVLEVRSLLTGSNLTEKGDDGPNVSLATVVSSRTYSQSQAGTLGEFIPGVLFSRFVGAVEAGQPQPVLNLQQIAQNLNYRTNVGVVEASGHAVSALLSVFNSAGDKLKEIPVELQPNEQKQLNSLLAANNITLDDGRIEVRVTGGEGRVTAYAAVIDNRTRDQLFVPSTTLGLSSSSLYVLPGIADLNAGAARWRSDMRLFNSGTDAQVATLTLHRLNNDGAPLTATVTVQPNEVKVLDNIVQTLFGANNIGGAVHVATSTLSSLVVTARTYNQTSNGTLGLFIPAVTPDEAIGKAGRSLNLVQAEDSVRYRTNVGIAEVTGQPVTVELMVHLPDSKVTPRIEIPLAANEFRQIGVLRELGIGNVYNARMSMRVIDGEGKITAYGSVVDMKTNDSTYVPAQ